MALADEYSVPLRYRLAERLASWLKRHGWCPTCRNTGEVGGLGCWDCWRFPASGPPDDVGPAHVGFYITFNYGDVWECDEDCPGCISKSYADTPGTASFVRDGDVS